MPGLLLSIVGQTVSRLLGSSGNLSNTTVADALVRVWSAILSLANLLQELFVRHHNAWKDAEPDVVAGANGLGQIAYNDAKAWERLLSTILPGSLRWLDGHTHQWVDAKYDWQLRSFWRYFDDLWTWRAQIRGWRHGFVDPSLVADNRFRRWFNGWPRMIVFRWKFWLEHPAQFGVWAGPYVARPVYAHVARREHKILRDQWTALFLRATADMPVEVERAIVRVLLSPA